jgi:hypothetical protein
MDTATSEPMALSEAAIRELRADLRGELIEPGDAAYDAARRVYNGMIDRYPRLIARCRDAADVISGVNFGREYGLTIAVRGGGHHGAGLGICDDALVIDLSPMNGTRVDPVARTIRVAGGCTLGDVDHATHAFSLAMPSGFMSTTGIAGLTLGGGLGHLTRACGLTIDNVLEVDVILADGTFVTANASQHPGLFWAVRGGGGNFGVVTSFVFKLHPIATVVAGPMLWPLERARELMQWYRDFIVAAPDEINGFFMFLKVPPGEPFPAELHTRTMCGVVWCYTGRAEHADVIFDPVRRVAGGPVLDLVGAMPLPSLQTMFDPLLPPGLQWYWRADWVNELSDAAIDTHLHYADTIPTQLSTMHLYPINGVAGRVGTSETAFSYRESTWGQVIIGIDPDPANAQLVKDWTVGYWEAMHPFSAGGAYINMMMDEGVDRVRAAYRGNYDRLVDVKRRYDPTNLFHVNQNINPNT